MKIRPARLAVLLMAVVGLVAVAAPPARATTTQRVAVFSVTLNLSDGLSNLVPCALGGTCGNTVNFTLSSSACVEVNAPGKSAPTGTDCSLSVDGVLTGFNGAATGAGTLFFRDSGGGWFVASAAVTMVGDVLTLSAQSSEGAFGATIVLFPQPEPEPTEEDPPPPPEQQGNGLSTQSG